MKKNLISILDIIKFRIKQKQLPKEISGWYRGVSTNKILIMGDKTKRIIYYEPKSLYEKDIWWGDKILLLILHVKEINTEAKDIAAKMGISDIIQTIHKKERIPEDQRP